MKKIILAAALAAFATTASANVAGGPHDLTVTTNKVNAGGYGALAAGAVGTTPCQFCHTPHGANPDAAYSRAPLWNRQSLAATFTMYDSTKLAGGAAAISATPQAASITCLTCHEGSALLGTTYSNSANSLLATNAAIANVGMLRVGTNLNDDHPVSVDYPTGGAGGFPAASPLPLYSNKIECATCHDPHLTGVQGSNLLRVSAATICVGCHTDK